MKFVCVCVCVWGGGKEKIVNEHRPKNTSQERFGCDGFYVQVTVRDQVLVTVRQRRGHAACYTQYK
jgi:hypothetical protein